MLLFHVSAFQSCRWISCSRCSCSNHRTTQCQYFSTFAAQRHSLCHVQMSVRSNYARMELRSFNSCKHCIASCYLTIKRRIVDLVQTRVTDSLESFVCTRICETWANPVDTPYEGGCFKVKLIFKGDFPAVPPKGEFLFVSFYSFLYIFIYLFFLKRVVD